MLVAFGVCMVAAYIILSGILALQPLQYISKKTEIIPHNRHNLGWWSCAFCGKRHADDVAQCPCRRDDNCSNEDKCNH